MERNIFHTQSFREVISRKKAVTADQTDLVQVIDRENTQWAEIIEEEQFHRSKVYMILNSTFSNGSMYMFRSRNLMLVCSWWATIETANVIKNLPKLSEVQHLQQTRPVLSPPRPQIPSGLRSHLNKLKEEVFNILLKAVNANIGAASRMLDISCSMLYPGWFKDVLICRENFIYP